MEASIIKHNPLGTEPITPLIIHGVMYAGPIADFAAASMAFVLFRGEMQQLKKLEEETARGES